MVGDCRLHSQTTQEGRKLTTTGQLTNSFLPTYKASSHMAPKQTKVSVGCDRVTELCFR